MGSNVDGQLGLGDRSVVQKTSPVLVEGLLREKPFAVSAGGAHSAVITERGQLYMWGLGNMGQLGLGTSMTEWEPQHVPFTEP